MKLRLVLIRDAGDERTTKFAATVTHRKEDLDDGEIVIARLLCRALAALHASSLQVIMEILKEERDIPFWLHLTDAYEKWSGDINFEDCLQLVVNEEKLTGNSP